LDEVGCSRIHGPYQLLFEEEQQNKIKIKIKKIYDRNGAQVLRSWIEFLRPMLGLSAYCFDALLISFTIRWVDP
jgi:hypothetical protein